jgi:hypothetical protein
VIKGPAGPGVPGHCKPSVSERVIVARHAQAETRCKEIGLGFDASKRAWIGEESC